MGKPNLHPGEFQEGRAIDIAFGIYLRDLRVLRGGLMIARMESRIPSWHCPQGRWRFLLKKSHRLKTVLNLKLTCCFQ